MGGNYYSQDYRAGNTHRLQYMDTHFVSLLSNSDEKKLIDFQSFDIALKNAFSKDASLGGYYDGMTAEDKALFFNRPVVQDLVRKNLGISRKDYESVNEARVERQLEPKKEKEIFYKAVYLDKKTNTSHLTLARAKRITIRGVAHTRYIDSRGKFVKKIDYGQDSKKSDSYKT